MATSQEVLNTLAELIAKDSGLFGGMRQKENDAATTAAAQIKLQEDQVKAMKAVVKKLQTLGIKHYESQEELDKELASLERIAKKANKSLKDLGIKSSKVMDVNTKKYSYFIDKQKTVTEDLTKESELLELAIIDNKEAFVKNTRKSGIQRKAQDKVITGLKYMGKEFAKHAENEQRFAQQAAVADAGWVSGMLDMGISQIEYMKLLKETRVEGLAAASAGVDFRKSLEESQNSLIYLTANTEEAAKVSGMFHKNMARMGVSQDQLGDAVLQQTAMYKNNYRALGYTAEQFAALSEELINDQGMRSTLINLQEKERKQYILGIQQRMTEYQTMGYTIERAKELQKTFQALGEMSPKERMKQAAKKRAMMGAMGMGAEGAELMDLEIRYKTMSAADKLVAEKRMAEIQAQGAKALGEMTGAGATIGQSMAMQMMAQKTGFDNVAKTFEKETGKGIKFDEKLRDNTSEISRISALILKAMNFWGGAEQSALGSLLTNTLKGLAGLGATIVAAVGIGKIAGSIGKMGGKAKGGVAKMGGKLAGAAATGATVAGKGAKAVAGATKAAAGVGKAALKSGIKKIPIIGALAAIGFAVNRAMDGDLIGAGMEMASGVAAIVPGIGTAASIGIDAALMGRDLAGGGTEQKITNEVTKTTKPATKDRATTIDAAAVERDNRLISTLQELQSYLKGVNQQNSELAMSGIKTAEANIATIRHNSLGRNG